MHKNGWFDTEGFYAALDGVRQARRLNWKQVAGESGVSTSTLTRMAQGKHLKGKRKHLNVDSLTALCVWSGLYADDFTRTLGGWPEAEPLAMISVYLRADRNLSPEAATALEELVKVAYERKRQR